jgi:pyruvate dehydrogenase E1 component alpha subunit
MIDEETFKALDKEKKDLVIASMKYAEESPWPNPIQLEEDVFAN